MTIGNFAEILGILTKIDPCRRLNSACLQTVVCKMKKFCETILFYRIVCYILNDRQIAGQAHKRAVFHIVLFYMT